MPTPLAPGRAPRNTFSTGGNISNVYSEHSSFVKFVERNWMLNTSLSERSRDNLPNPKTERQVLCAEQHVGHRRPVRLVQTLGVNTKAE
jgi:hypothetical protein